SLASAAGCRAGVTRAVRGELHDRDSGKVSARSERLSAREGDEPAAPPERIAVQRVGEIETKEILRRARKAHAEAHADVALQAHEARQAAVRGVAEVGEGDDAGRRELQDLAPEVEALLEVDDEGAVTVERVHPVAA